MAAVFQRFFQNGIIFITFSVMTSGNVAYEINHTVSSVSLDSKSCERNQMVLKMICGKILYHRFHFFSDAKWPWRNWFFWMGSWFDKSYRNELKKFPSRNFHDFSRDKRDTIWIEYVSIISKRKFYCTLILGFKLLKNQTFFFKFRWILDKLSKRIKHDM